MPIATQPSSVLSETGIPKRRLHLRPRQVRTPLNLENADLRNMDLRGLDLSSANLRGADLRHARTGIRPGWGAVLSASSLLASLVIGVLSGYVGQLLEHMVFSRVDAERVLGLLLASALILFVLASAWKGLRTGATWVLLPVAAVSLMSGILSTLTGGTGEGGFRVCAIALAMGALLALGALARTTAGTVRHFLFVVAALSGAWAGKAVGGGLAAAALAIGAMLVGRRALHNAALSPALTRFSVRLACLGGTSFRGADLTNASLSSAELKCCDFRGATLAGVNLEGTRVQLCAFDRVQPPAPASSGALG
jgi:uncharacterized protein YjbI with pentapeptide repeats